MAYNDMAGIESAEGLQPHEADMVARLSKVLRDKMARNMLRKRYYEDKTELKNLGLAVPPRFETMVDVSVGWAAKAVDALAARSRFDGFVCDGDDGDRLRDVMSQNGFSDQYKAAVTSELVHSCGFWTVSPGADGTDEPDAVVTYHDAETASALWDFRRKRVLAGLVVEDWRLRSARSTRFEPSTVVVHTPESVITLERGDGNNWSVTDRGSVLVGRPLIEPMCYKPTTGRPFGKSRVSRTVMAITDDMQREILRTSLHSELFSSSQKAILGVTDEQYDAIMADKYRAAMSSLFVATKDRQDGSVPTLAQFQQASMEPHVAMMNKLAARMASETNLPVSAFGVDSSVYQSVDALRASTDDLVIEAESFNETNGRAIKNVAMLAWCVAENRRFSDMPDSVRGVSVRWKDPSMPSEAAQSDSMLKQVSFLGEKFGKSEVCLEKLGYDSDQIARIKADLDQGSAMDSLAAELSAIGANGAS